MGGSPGPLGAGRLSLGGNLWRRPPGGQSRNGRRPGGGRGGVGQAI